MWEIARSVLIFLGIPLIAGFLTRRLGEKARGRTWYETELIPRIGPFALYGLLFTIVVLFALQGEAITSRPLDVVRIALPLLVYFALMWAGSMALGKTVGLDYPGAEPAVRDDQIRQGPQQLPCQHRQHILTQQALWPTPVEEHAVHAQGLLRHRGGHQTPTS